LIGEAHPAYLEIFPGGDSSEMMDGIVLGFIVMGKEREDIQTAGEALGDALS
jgi:hypothetical protein